jgi:hypothetical protein
LVSINISYDKYFKIKTLKLNGKIDNFIGKFDIKIEEKDKYGVDYVSYGAEGYLIIKEDYKTIEVMEKINDETKIKEWIKKNI